jgi:hypothetical protein
MGSSRAGDSWAFLGGTLLGMPRFDSSFLAYPIYLTLNSTNTGGATALYGLAGSAVAASNRGTSSQLNAGGISGPLATSSVFGSAEVYIPNYTATTSKVYSGFGAGESNVNFAPAGDSEQGMINIYAGSVAVTTAVTAITIDAPGNFVSGSSFYLYGIKNS